MFPYLFNQKLYFKLKKGGGSNDLPLFILMDLFIAPYFRPDNMTPKICHFVTLKKVVPPLYRRFLFILTISADNVK